MTNPTHPPPPTDEEHSDDTELLMATVEVLSRIETDLSSIKQYIKHLYWLTVGPVLVFLVLAAIGLLLSAG